MEFRPCIDVHNGKVKQIVGSSLKDAGDRAEENFVSEQDAAFYAELYRKRNIKGGHVILLNSADSPYYEATKEQAMKALRAYPGGFQAGGGINPENAGEFLEAGASHVIVTSYVFRDGRIHGERLKRLVQAVGRERLVLDLSCRKREGKYYIVTDRWQQFTEEQVCPELLDRLAESCDEFLIHAVDVEGKSNGIQEELVGLLGSWGKLPMTYAGGVGSFEDLDKLRRLGRDRLNVTIGSALDIFGGDMPFEQVLARLKKQQSKSRKERKESMYQINENYTKLPGSYLFSTITKKVAAYTKANPDKELIRLGIGDVTLPICQAVIKALHGAVDEMGKAETFHGYAPDLGYEFLRRAVADHDYKSRGCEVAIDEIFISDGAKSDSGNIQEIFGVANRIAVCDPVYPVYVDSNVMAGRTGTYDPGKETWSDVVYMPSTAENGFVPELPKERPDIIYLCLPNNPTGTTLTKEQLQKWVDYALEMKSVIIFDAAYEAYITEDDVPHSIYECEGARGCAIEIRSFSKNAGFTGMRLGFTVVPKDLVCEGVSLNALWARRHGTKFNGAPYIVQRAGEAVYSEEGKVQIRQQVDYYMENAKTIKKGLADAGFEVYGGVNAPYIWLKTPDGMSSWAFFDYLLEKANVVGTPGSGFGPSGEGYFRLTAFGKHEDTVRALERIRKL